MYQFQIDQHYENNPSQIQKHGQKLSHHYLRQGLVLLSNSDSNEHIISKLYLPRSATWQAKIGESESNSSTSTRFRSGLGAKKKVSPSSKGMAELNSGSSSSSPRCAI